MKHLAVLLLVVLTLALSACDVLYAGWGAMYRAKGGWYSNSNERRTPPLHEDQR